MKKNVQFQDEKDNSKNSSPTLELKTKVEIDKSMKLIDINGKKISFRSDCFIKPNNPNDSFYVAIVNQTDLDEGNIKFEVASNIFKRRVTYESSDGEHLNHYIAVKKLPTNPTENPIACDVIIRLTELDTQIELQSPLQTPLSSPLSSQLSSPLSSPLLPNDIDKDQEIEQLKEELYKLSNSNEYKDEQQVNTISSTTSPDFYKKIGIFCLITFVLFILLKKR